MSRRFPLTRESVRLARLTRLLAHVGCGVLLGYLGFATLALTGLDPDNARRGAIVRWWMRRLLRILNVRVSVEGEPPVASALFAANHISWLDIPVLRSVVDTSFVSKREVRDWPIIGGLAVRAGTIFLARGDRQTLTHADDHMTWTLHQGQAVAIFPEGTTTDGSSVLHFHARLYQAAIRTQAPVQAVALHYPTNTARVAAAADNLVAKSTHPAAPFVGEMDLARHLWKLLGARDLTARLCFCHPLAASQDRRRLADTTRAQIIGALGLASLDEAELRQSGFIAR
jgi:1-acyl-sn-glycerol-3-phosphate acyltransferase